MLKCWQTMAIVAAGTWCPAMALAGGGKEMAKSPAQVQQTLNEMDKPLADLVRSAEGKIGGKAACAHVCEWRNVQPKFSQANSNVVAGTKAETSKFEPSHAVGVVTVAANGKLIEAVVCSTTGEVLATKECDHYERGRSAYMDAGSTQGVAHSGGSSTYATNWRNRWTQAPNRWQKAEDVIGKGVTNRATGETIGSVKDLAVDPDAGRVIYAVVEFSSKMGHGNRWYAVPMSAIELAPDYKTMQIDYSTSQMNEANGFDSKHWPNLVEEKWAAQTYRNFNQTPYWQGTAMARADGTPVARVSIQDKSTGIAPNRWQKMNDLIGKEVKNPQGESLGSIKDVAVDPDSGRILYGVLSFGGFLGLGDKYFAIPWSALELTPDAKQVTLAIEKDRLKNAEGFDKNNWPNLADQRWATGVHQFYNRPVYWSDTNTNPNAGEGASDVDRTSSSGSDINP